MKDRPDPAQFSSQLEDHLNLFFDIDDIQVIFKPQNCGVSVEYFEGIEFLSLDLGEAELTIQFESDGGHFQPMIGQFGAEHPFAGA